MSVIRLSVLTVSSWVSFFHMGRKSSTFISMQFRVRSLTQFLPRGRTDPYDIRIKSFLRYDDFVQWIKTIYAFYLTITVIMIQQPILKFRSISRCINNKRKKKRKKLLRSNGITKIGKYRPRTIEPRTHDRCAIKLHHKPKNSVRGFRRIR